MSNATTPRAVDRRSIIRGAAATAVAGLGAAAVARPASASTSTARGTVTLGPTKVRSSLQVVDAQDEQRFLFSATKPPIIVQGRTIPADQRLGRDDASYFIFNDEDQNEKGGIVISSESAQVALDYPNAQGATLNTRWNTDKQGVAQLILTEMPDPDLPVENVTTTDRVLLACSNAGEGALLMMMGSDERPRILLQVDGNDVPRLLFFDAGGNVVAQLPPAEAGAAKASKPDAEALLQRFGRR